MIKCVEVPCKDCKERKVGCHGSCDRYKDYKSELERVRSKVFKENEHNRYFNDAKMKSIMRGGGL